MRFATQIAIAAGILSGILFASALVGAPVILFQNFTQLPLLAVGLALGTVPALISGAVATLAAFVLDANSGFIFLAVYALPSVLLVRQALMSRADADGKTEWYPPGNLIAQLAGYALCVLVLVSLLLLGKGGLESAVGDFVRQFSAAVFGEADTPPEKILLENAFLFPALIGTFWVLMMVVNGVLAQALVAAFGRATRPTPRYAHIALPDWIGLLTLGAGLAWLIGGGFRFTAGAALIILLTPFFLQGLAVVHMVVPRTGARPWVLSAFYLLLVLPLWRTVLVTVLGMAEQWLHLRARRGMV